MKHDLLCMNSDRVNRYGDVFPVSTMEKSLKEIFDKGMPLLIGHDFSRPVGWNLPFALYLESHLGRMISNRFVATSYSEMTAIRNAVQTFIGERCAKEFREKGQPFLDVVAPNLTANRTLVENECLAIIDREIATRTFSWLFEEVDVDGLLPLALILKNFEYLSQGVFKHKASELCLFAHEFFRRSQSRFNCFHFFFLDAFVAIAGLPESTFKIRLDKHMIGYAPTFHERGELEYHYGPKYNDDISKMKMGLSRFECTPAERAYHNVSSTEFYWKKEKEEFAFELEELKDDPSPEAGELYHCRYIHSYYREDSDSFRHFDGAIRSYDMQQMVDRVDKTFVQYGRKAQYKKLFRIDGKLPLASWKSLITHYMQGNPLIYEYFDLKQDLQSFEVTPISRTLYEGLVPFDMKKEEGLKIMVSYHRLPEDEKQGRYIDIYDIMKDGGENIYCLEHLIVEVKNALGMTGEDLEIRDDIAYIKCNDAFWNVPSIMHRGNAEQSLQKTVDAFVSLFSAMVEKSCELFVSLTLSFEFNQRVIRVSSYGHIENLLDWLRHQFPIPFTESGLTDWVQKQRNYLNKFEANTDSPLLNHLVNSDGVMYIKRVPIEFPCRFEEDDRGLKTIVSFPADHEILKLLEQDRIRAVFCMQVKKAVWSDTREDYFVAGRSKWLSNSGAHVELLECAPLAAYWSK